MFKNMQKLTNKLNIPHFYQLVQINDHIFKHWP